MKYSLHYILFIFTIANAIGQEDVLINSLGIKFKKINPGSFQMSVFRPTVSLVGFFSDQQEQENDPLLLYAKAGAKKSNEEGFKVAVDKEYFIGVYEISQKEWVSVLNKNPAHFNEKYIGISTDAHPVENISIRDCNKFIKKLNKIDKGKYSYRLPTEIEWEYAARAGNQDDIAWVEIWKSSVTGVQEPARRGTKAPNAWGLFDMLGNIWEWTSDKYNEKLFADKIPSTKFTGNVIKGSCFYGDVKNATYMTHGGGEGKRYDIGLRLVMEKVK